ncbi:MAG: stage II sporulation protein R [Clostridia bacterium]|nr:stage II sporulation protein R [Clostridia bacterium]
MIKNIFKKISLPLFVCILSIILLNTYIVLSIYSQKKVAKNSFRLHIVANSNNTNDQIIKLKISEKVQNYIDSLTKNTDTKQDAINVISSNIQNILKITNNDLKSQNVSYTAYAKMGNIFYDEKLNENIIMPMGTYDSLQIVLGDGGGKNFWSLIFPNEQNIDKLKEYETFLPGISKIYNSERLDNTENSTEVTYSFKVLELFENLF